MIKTKKWQEAESESSVNMNTEDWMADEIDGLRDELASVYQQRAELLTALQMMMPWYMAKTPKNILNLAVSAIKKATGN